MTHKAVELVAELMALSARTAPKGKGQDSILIRVVAGEELQELSRELDRLGQARGIKFYLRDAKNLEESDACVLIAARSKDHAGLNCGGCGFVDNRIMFTAGVAALSLGWMEGCLVAYGIPLKASGKSIYFDRRA